MFERRDGRAPRQRARDLEPLRVLVEHRVDDVDERLVAREEPVAPGQEVALEPALAHVLAQDLEHAAVGRRGASSPGVDRQHPAPVRDLEHGVPAVRGGLVRAHDRGSSSPARWPGSRRAGSAPWTRVASPSTRAGRGRRRRRAPRASGSAQVDEQAPAVRVRVARPCAARRAGASAASSARSAPFCVEQLARAGSERIQRSSRRTRSGCSCTSAIGTWCARNVPSTGLPSKRLRARSSPSGVRSTIIGPRGRASRAPRARRARRACRCRAWMARIAQRVSTARAMATVHARRVVALDPDRRVPVAAQQRVELARAAARDEHGRPGDLGAVQVQDRAARRRRSPGSTNLFACQLAASGPVSASPSPTRTAASRSGCVERRAVGVRQRVAELAALVDRARRLGRDVARDAARERELPERGAPGPARRGETSRVDLAVGALEVDVRHHARPAVARARRRRARPGRGPRSRGSACA